MFDDNMFEDDRASGAAAVAEKPRVRMYAILGDEIKKPSPKQSPRVVKVEFQPRGIHAVHLGQQCKCGHCKGVGTIQGALCFQCQGKGWQSDRDRYFNARYQARRAAAAEMDDLMQQAAGLM